MEQTAKTTTKDSKETKEAPITKPLAATSSLPKILIIVIVLALVSGTLTGYLMTQQSGGGTKLPTLNQPPKTASQDNQTFRDFAEGTIQPKPAPSDPSEYSEGTHLLEREGQVNVALTSSVVDLSKYEGKKVKIFGETQKALKEGWLMDVGKVEEE